MHKTVRLTCAVPTFEKFIVQLCAHYFRHDVIRLCDQGRDNVPSALNVNVKKARVNGKSNYDSLKYFHKSPLPVTDPHHTVIKQFLLLGLAAEYRLDGGCDQHCRRPSDVYDTHRRTKLTAPETISRRLYSKNEKNRSLSYPFWTEG